MNHYIREKWLEYIQQQLPQQERIIMETHLYSCDLCLAEYTTCAEEMTLQLPYLENEDEFTASVMERIGSISPTAFKTSVSIPFYRKTLFHYTAAAMITLLFMSVGTFQGLFTDTRPWQEAQEWQTISDQLEQSKHHPSLSEQLMNKTVQIIDSLQPKL